MADTDEKKPEVPTIPGVLMMLANLIFKREAIMVLASAAVLIAIGAGGVVYAQARFDGGIAERVDAGIAAEAREREALAERLNAHVEESKAAHLQQTETQRRTEAKVDRMEQRLELALEAIYELRGKQPPPAPPPLQLDGGR